MRRVLPQCVALAALILVVFFLAQESSAQNLNTLKGRYAFTLAEKCVHQLNFLENFPGFDDTGLINTPPFPIKLVDPAGAETYSGASDGFMIFDGKGGFRVEQGRATNIMNADNRLTGPPFPPNTPPSPLGFGLGSAIPFTCTGTYTLNAGKITINPVTCNATVSLPNAFGATGFQSQFPLEGFLPQTGNALVLTDIGDTVQPVTIFFPPGHPFSPSRHQQRICTRAVTLVLVSPQP